MDEALELANYLPLSFKTVSERDYIAFLWRAFETNYEKGNYQFAFLAYHMLTMSFVYFIIWQIKHHMKDDFAKAMIGFTSRDLDGFIHKDDEDDEKKWSVSPFNFSKVQERSILRVLALIGCDKAKIGTYAKLVDDRNDSAHSNGNIYYISQHDVDVKIAGVLRIVEEIQAHSRNVVESCYHGFLLNSHVAEEREYPEWASPMMYAIQNERVCCF